MSEREDLESVVLRALRKEPADDQKAKARVFERLAATTGAWTSTKTSSSHGGGVGSTLVAASKHPAALVVTFLLGGATGAVLHARLAPQPEPPILQAPSPREEKRSVIPPIVTSLPAMAPSASGPAARAPAPRKLESSSAGNHIARGDEIAAQQQLLDAARDAFARGEYVATLESLSEHERGYPQGLLSEEREALAIKTLAQLGSYPAAKARAARFRERFPNSLLLASIREALGEVP